MTFFEIIGDCATFLTGIGLSYLEEIETFDFSLCCGFSNKDTVRRSLDGQFFIVEGETFNTYTQQEMLVICEGNNWTSTEEGI